MCIVYQGSYAPLKERKSLSLLAFRMHWGLSQLECLYFCSVYTQLESDRISLVELNS